MGRMKQVRRIKLLLVISFVVLSGTAFMPSMSFAEKDSGKSFEEYLSLAKQGDAEAQLHLGNMYKKGKGVPKDYKEAVRWYRKAAEQGYVRTQYTLGVMYRDGEGVPKDLVASYAWLNISAAQGYKDFLDEVRASELRDRVAKKLPAAALAIAQELSMEYYKKYVEPFQ